jgi:CBS domain-containing protein
MRLVSIEDVGPVLRRMRMSRTSLGTLVTYNPWSVGPTELLTDVAARFQEMGLHHVAVVDSERRAIGILSETDLLRARQTQRAVLVGAGTHDTGDAPLIFARDVMTRDIVSVPPTASFRDALDLLLKRQIHALPVIDQGRLVGMICSRDFLREFSYGELPGTREPIAGLLAGKPPETIGPDMSLDDALLLMHEAGVACLAVVQGDCPLGVVSQRDIVREKCRVEEQAEFHPEMRPANSVMQVTRNSPAIRSGQRLCEAAAAMIDHNLPAVTVVNQSNRLLGLITEDDLLRVLYDGQE